MQHLVRRANIRIFQFPEIFHPKIANFVIVSTLLFIFFAFLHYFAIFISENGPIKVQSSITDIWSK